MYRITDEDGNFIAQVDSPRYVRLKEETGTWIQCSQIFAECIAIKGIRYSLAGRDKVADAPISVYVREIDAADELYKTAKSADTNANDIQVLSWAMTQMATEILQLFNSENQNE